MRAARVLHAWWWLRCSRWAVRWMTRHDPARVELMRTCAADYAEALHRAEHATVIRFGCVADSP